MDDKRSIFDTAFDWALARELTATGERSVVLISVMTMCMSIIQRESAKPYMVNTARHVYKDTRVWFLLLRP